MYNDRAYSQAPVREVVPILTGDRTEEVDLTRSDGEILVPARRLRSQMLNVRRELEQATAYVEAAIAQCSRLRDNRALAEDPHLLRHALHLQARLDALVPQIQDAFEVLDRLQAQESISPFQWNAFLSDLTRDALDESEEPYEKQRRARHLRTAR